MINYRKIEENIIRLSKNNELILVLKDNAYGFGVDKVFDIAYKCGVRRFAVNKIDEAISLREKNKEIEILLFGYQINNLSFIKEYNILPTISSTYEFDLYKENSIHMALEFDSGMNRFGFKKIDEDILLSPFITTIYTHLASEGQNNYDVIDYLYNLSVKYNKKIHIGGSLAYHYTSLPIRIGKDIYIDADSFYGNVLYVHKGFKGEKVGYEGSYILDHDTNIVIIDVGYSNGLKRDYKGRVFVNGRLASVVGKICMDHTFIVCDFDIRIGDIVEFYGRNLAKEEFLCNNSITIYESFLLMK